MVAANCFLSFYYLERNIINPSEPKVRNLTEINKLKKQILHLNSKNMK